MVKNEILTEYWDLKEVNDAFSKMQPEELQYDLKAEVFLVLCEMDEQKLIGMYERNELKFYIVRTMLNMIKSDRSSFYKNYRNHIEMDNNTISKEMNRLHIETTDIVDKLEKNLENELSRKTGIPYMSIVRTLHKTKTEMKKNIRK